MHGIGQGSRSEGSVWHGDVLREKIAYGRGESMATKTEGPIETTKETEESQTSQKEETKTKTFQIEKIKIKASTTKES